MHLTCVISGSSTSPTWRWASWPAASSSLYWIANRRRIAAETIGRAQEQAQRIRRDAERDAEARLKEAVLAGKERAHEMLVDAERQARERRQEVSRLEQTLAEQARALADRAAAVERNEQDLRTRDKAVAAARAGRR